MMNYIFLVPLSAFMIGLVGVASAPSPFYGALGLVLAAGGSCGLLFSQGGTFLSLILFLIYLGGILVVFAYTAAIATDDYPKAVGSLLIGCLGVGFFVGVIGGMVIFKDYLGDTWWAALGESGEFLVFSEETVGAILLYSRGGAVLIAVGYILLITLLIILAVVRGKGSGGNRLIREEEGY